MPMSLVSVTLVVADDTMWAPIVIMADMAVFTWLATS